MAALFCEFQSTMYFSNWDYTSLGTVGRRINMRTDFPLPVGEIYTNSKLLLQEFIVTGVQDVGSAEKGIISK